MKVFGREVFGYRIEEVRVSERVANPTYRVNEIRISVQWCRHIQTGDAPLLVKLNEGLVWY